VLAPGGQAVVSRSAAGRGAWLCVPPIPCFDLAVRRKAFERAWRQPVGAGTLDDLRELLSRGRGETKDDVGD
jgi:predicted RNA-binding protein YlxR (DUF448 family)